MSLKLIFMPSAFCGNTCAALHQNGRSSVARECASAAVSAHLYAWEIMKSYAVGPVLASFDDQAGTAL